MINPNKLQEQIRKWIDKQTEQGNTVSVHVVEKSVSLPASGHSSQFRVRLNSIVWKASQPDSDKVIVLSQDGTQSIETK